LEDNFNVRNKKPDLIRLISLLTEAAQMKQNKKKTTKLGAFRAAFSYYQLFLRGRVANSMKNISGQLETFMGTLKNKQNLCLGSI